MQQLFKIEPIIKKLTHLLHEEHLLRLATKSGFIKRKPRKLDARNMLLALFLRVIQGASSFSSIAMSIGMLKGIHVSKQAVSKRINESFVLYLESVLGSVLAQKLQPVHTIVSTCFTRIIVHDSTTVRLPSELAKEFPGNSNGRSTFALVKIQAVYDLLQEQFCSFWFSPFTVNDQQVATTMLDYVQSGGSAYSRLRILCHIGIDADTTEGCFLYHSFKTWCGSK